MRAGFRFTALIGSAVTIVGAVLTTLLTADASLLEVAGASFVVGAGLGFVAGPTLIAAQSTVGWSERGVVTGTNMFSRSMGSALGVALFGAIANANLGYGQHPHSAAELARASHHVFVGVAVVAALMGLAVIAMPQVRPTRLDPPPTDDEADAPAAAAERSPSPLTTCDRR